MEGGVLCLYFSCEHFMEWKLELSPIFTPLFFSALETIRDSKCSNSIIADIPIDYHRTNSYPGRMSLCGLSL